MLVQESEKKTELKPNELFVTLDLLKKSTLSKSCLLPPCRCGPRYLSLCQDKLPNLLHLPILSKCQLYTGWDGWTKWLFQLECTL